MKKINLLIISCFFALNIFAQREAANWYFGENAGLSFNLNNNTVSDASFGRLNTREGCSSISDDTGNLLFYTDGLTIWNRNHLPMSNGNGLYGDESSTQSAIIVPKPGDPNIYFVFTVDDIQQNNGNTLGLNYSEVDMTRDGGLGEVTIKNINLLDACSEKITAVLKDCITKSIWVVTFASENGNTPLFDTFHAFEVTSSGVNAKSVKSSFDTVFSERRGYLKLSPDGTKVASANIRNGLFIYDFDAATGKVSNEESLFINSSNEGIHPYGVEFSPNSKLLYVNSSNDFFANDPQINNNITNHASTLTQFDLSKADIQASEELIDRRALFRGALQLGPNGKIYRALSISYDVGLPYLGVIENPNIEGVECIYNHNAIDLSPYKSSQGLPPFITSFFNTEIDIIKNGKSTINLALCAGDTYTLISENIPGAIYSWTLDNVPIAGNNFELQISQGGHYELYIDPNNGDCAIEGQAFVEFNENPLAFDHTILQCDEDGLVDGFTLFNLNEANDVLTGGIPNRSTKFYTDIARTNEVNGNMFSNTSNPQIIYVEVINSGTECFATSELTLNVSITDSNDTILPAVCDDDGIEDGLHVFDLSVANSDIVNGLPPGLDISYFETYEDALLEVNNLGTTYTNTTPYNQTIYARVENANNCYGISEVTLIVNELPSILTEDLTYYCLNKFPQLISLNAAIINDSPNNYTYNWSTGENTFEIEINEPGTYSVTVTNANGCNKERNIIVEASNIASFETIEINDVSQNNTITVLTSGEGIYEYRLLDENDLVYLPYQESNVF
jgi:hypothetical protein